VKRALVLGVLAACAGAAPRSPAPKRVVHDTVQPVKTVKAPLAYADEPYGPTDWVAAEASVTCEEPEGSFAIAAMPPPPPDEMETRGWASVGQIVFREGCVSPSRLEISLRDAEPALLDCFAAQTSEPVTVIARLELASGRSPYVSTRMTPRDWSDERPDPSLGLEQLDACFIRAFASLYLDGSAVVDVEIERGFPAEGGVMMGP
jgi:hypothetical protein